MKPLKDGSPFMAEPTKRAYRGTFSVFLFFLKLCCSSHGMMRANSAVAGGDDSINN